MAYTLKKLSVLAMVALLDRLTRLYLIELIPSYDNLHTSVSLPKQFNPLGNFWVLSNHIAFEGL